MYRAPRMHPRRQQRGGDVNISPALIMLGMRLWQAYEDSPVKANVTFALAAYNMAAHVYPPLAMPFSLDEICISPSSVAAAWRWGDVQGLALRLVGSCFAHADDMHLYYNMGSLLVKGVQLERSMGAEAFGAFVAFACVASSLISVVLGTALERLVGYHSGCAVGFSGVLFAMKVLANYGRHAAGSNATAHVWGVRTSARHAHWLEIIVSSYLSPRSSLVGHAAGALAGILWLQLPYLKALWDAKMGRGGGGGPGGGPGGKRYTYARGPARRQTYGEAMAANGARPTGAAPAPAASAPAPAPAPPPALDDDDDWEPVPQPVPAARSNESADALRRRRVARFDTGSG